MLWTILDTAGGFLKRIPWQVWAIAAILLTAWIWGNHRYSQGVEDERDRWEQLVEVAEDAAKDADVGAAERRGTDTERTNADDTARREAARTGGRDAVNCARLQRAYPDRSFPACD